MNQSTIINGIFERKHLGTLHEKMPVPTGWFVLPFNLMPKKDDRRYYHGQWFTIKSEHKKIYRVLRFAPKLHGSLKDDNHKEILLDWVGWIDLCGKDEEVEIPLILRITKSTLWERLICAGLNHPEPTYRISSKLALISVILGLLSVILAVFL
jgi:hypothetical protein